MSKVNLELGSIKELKGLKISDLPGGSDNGGLWNPANGTLNDVKFDYEIKDFTTDKKEVKQWTKIAVHSGGNTYDASLRKSKMSVWTSDKLIVSAKQVIFEKGVILRIDTPTFAE